MITKKSKKEYSNQMILVFKIKKRSIKEYLYNIYMSLYVCEECNFHTSLAYNYNRHIKTKKHLQITQKSPESHHFGVTFVPESHHFLLKKGVKEQEHYSCKYCKKEFKYKQGLYRHIKYTCRKSNDEDLKELVRLLNLQLKQKDDKIDMLYSQTERQNKQIDKLMDKLEVNNITTNNIIQNNHIQLLSYKETDTSHLTENDYIQSLKKVTYCVKDLIEKIHFNPFKPENMNIFISNIKDKYLMVYEDGSWNLKHKDKELNDLYDSKEILLEDWIQQYQTKYPDLKKKFNRYLNNKENDETMNVIKEEIKLMMYNNKKKLIE